MGEFLPAGILVVVMVYGVVPDGNCAGVEVKVIRPFCGLQSHCVPSGKAAGFPVIRVEGKAVGGGENVIGNAQVTVSEFRLEVVDVSQSAVFGLPVNLLPRQVEVIQIDVVSALRPVEHNVAVREGAVGEHHLRGPGAAAVLVKVRVVVFRLFNRYIAVILLQSGNVGHILQGYAVLEFTCARLPCYVSKFRPVYEDTGLYAGAVTESEAPVAALSGDPSASLGMTIEPHFHAGIIGNIGQDIGPYGGIEKDVGHPAGFESVIPAAACRQGVREFPKDAAAEAVVAVYGAYPGACEHAAKPGTFLHNEHACPVTGRLYCCSRASRAAAHHYHVIRGRACRRKEAQYYRKDKPLIHS